MELICTLPPAFFLCSCTPFLCSYFCLSISPDNLSFFPSLNEENILSFLSSKLLSSFPPLIYPPSLTGSPYLSFFSLPSSLNRTPPQCAPIISKNLQKMQWIREKERAAQEKSKDRWWGAGNVGTKTERIMWRDRMTQIKKQKKSLREISLCNKTLPLALFLHMLRINPLFMKDGDANYSCPTGRGRTELSEGSRNMWLC